MSLKNPPEGYHSLTPYLIVDDAEAALVFYARAFGAIEKVRMPMGDKIAHAEILIGDSHLMLSDEWPDLDRLSPRSRGGPTASLLLYVANVDAGFARAIDAGATIDRAIENQFWGDRMGTLIDPFGHKWMLATHMEDVDGTEMERRITEFSAMARNEAGRTASRKKAGGSPRRPVRKMMVAIRPCSSGCPCRVP